MGSQNSANCPGIKQLCRTGYVVTAPMDFIIQTNGDGASFSYEIPNQFSRHTNYISNHDPSQVMPLIDSPRDTLAHIIKLETPWRVRSSDDIVCYNNQCGGTMSQDSKQLLVCLIHDMHCK